MHVDTTTKLQAQQASQSLYVRNVTWSARYVFQKTSPGWFALIVLIALLAGAANTAGAGAGASGSQQPSVLAGGLHGGFVVRLGCGDTDALVALRPSDSFLVQGLDTSAQNVQTARQRIRDRGLYGPVTAREFDGVHLPYQDNMVNLLVVDNPFSVSRDEMMRVLCPNGQLRIREGGQWKTEIKPRPADMDEWPHYHYNPQGTMVGRDRMVGPPRRIQWMGDPKWLRNHDFMSSMHAMVSSGGRIFYILDEGLRAHVFLPARWMLIARDAFNGTILWKRPLIDWQPYNWPLKSGPGYLPRRIVAVGDRVFVTLGLREPVSAVNAATGEVIRTYEGTKTTEEILFSDGVLYLLTDPARPPVNYRAETSTYTEIKRANTGWGWTKDSPERTVMAVEEKSGKILWKHTAKVAPLTLTLGETRVFFFDGERITALDRQTGSPLWHSDPAPRLVIQPATGAAPRLILSEEILVLCHGTQVFGFSANDGKRLWEGAIPPTGHYSPSDLFVINGLIWSAHTGRPQDTGTPMVALNLRTGETVKDFVAENIPGFPMHPRCYPGRATERYIMLAGMGTEFYEIGGNKVDVHDYIRGSCIYGVMPCNGLLYKPPDSCACFYMSKLEYLCALAPDDPRAGTAQPFPEDKRLEKGPAYADAATPGPAAGPEDWPMYRRDPARTGFGQTAVPADLKEAWSATLGGKLTQPVVANGRLYVASADTHTIYAFDAASGKPLWQFTAGGRIDSPPTVDNGRVIFGAADGRVYCLRAADGALAWRYLAAPDDRQILSFQQPESVWPVSGSVLVYNGMVYALAGRNMFFDGGMRLVRLDAATGKKLSETVLDEIDPQTGRNLQTLIAVKSMPVANPDLLSCNGKYIYMATRKFDLEGRRVGPEPVSARVKEFSGEDNHLFCPTGFLDDLWFHRTYWIYGQNAGEGWAEYSQAQRAVPCGRIMALDDQRAYGFRADNLGNTLLPTPTYRLYAADRALKEEIAATSEAAAKAADIAAATPPKKAAKQAKKKSAAKGAADTLTTATAVVAPPKKAGTANIVGDLGRIAGPFKVYWQIVSPPLLVNAMALAGKSLVVAGPPDVADESKMLGFLPGDDDEINRQLREQEAAWRGEKGALLHIIGTEKGVTLARYRLESVPVFDGMIAACGRIYMSTMDGRVVCLGGGGKTLPPVADAR